MFIRVGESLAFTYGKHQFIFCTKGVETDQKWPLGLTDCKGIPAY